MRGKEGEKIHDEKGKNEGRKEITSGKGNDLYIREKGEMKEREGEGEKRQGEGKGREPKE